MNKKNASPFFTIIMPNYKTEAFLEEALDSVLNQTFTDYECILVNDGSPGVDI
ncbi:MAG: glycosyltransferase, partial [Thermales bacterium]|nr:glycosyltransferase [Thermales bacterium]